MYDGGYHFAYMVVGDEYRRQIMSTNRILDVKAKTGDAPFTHPADDEIYVLKARISDLRDACEQKQEILDSNKAIIAEQAERITALETACKSLAELAHQSHVYCEDSWYSCPMAEGGCADDRRGPQCDCGAEEQNMKVNSIMLSAGVG